MKCRHINVVVTCAARKTKPAPALARVKNLTTHTLEERFTEWSERIGRNSQNQVKAANLYQGNSWSIIRKLYEHPKHRGKIKLWVVSAGYGLISGDSIVAPYTATFASGHADSVNRPSQKNWTTGDWWEKLVQWRRQERHEYASISDIARKFPNQPLLIAISKEYLSATFDDISEALQFLSSPDKLVVISAGATKSGAIAENFLPCDARFESFFHCCRADLNARLLESIIKTYSASEISARKLRARYARKLSKLQKTALPIRSRCDDWELELFIVKQLQAGSVSRTYLLRTLRTEGRACEQNRFRKLFKKARRSLNKNGALR
jgi:hypothetical protein